MAATMVNGATENHALVSIGQRAVVPHTILGREETMQIRTGGRVRAGIKVLTRAAAANPQAARIYAQGLEQGRSFDEIERLIRETVKELAHPLTPKNVPYFTVRPADFPNPNIARQIMERYAEDRGDGEKRLYRFPVVFPADVWQKVMPHELVTWSASERVFWSEYSADGTTRLCKMYQPVPVVGNGQARRAVRIFGGRKIQLRPDNEGRCEPERCPQYQDRRCNLTGRFIFYIPGIETLDPIDLPTNSFYSMHSAIQKFQTIAFMRGGRISGFLDGKTPMYLTKRLQEVSHVAEDGKPGRVKQWLIELTAEIDVSNLLREVDGLEANVARQAEEAAGRLQGSSVSGPLVAESDGTPVDGHAGGNAQRDRRASAGAGKSTDVEDARMAGESQPAEGNANPGAGAASGQGQGGPVQTEGASQQEQAEGVLGSREATRAATAERTVAQARTAEGTVGGARGGGADKGGAAPRDDSDGVAWILESAEAKGVTKDRYEAYATKRWGKGWRVAAGGRKKALDELNDFQDDPAGFKRKVDAEIDVWG